MTYSIQNLETSNIIDTHGVDIGNAVKRSREALGYSVDDLALTSGLTGIEISKIEIGADVDPSRLKRLAAALQVPASDFVSL